MAKTPDPKLKTIETEDLDDVTGGKSHSTGSTTVNRLDGLISQMNSITSAAKEIDNKTKGFDDKQMLLLCMLAMDRRGRYRW